ncbi:hypothetical protein BDV28DRAFT_125990 [Aspergillus coremiiformis]|uniref:Uncharacterized protein n=1 Tax=Aspergillus coremiiformis TaxID=138285 RepID=A0A5N6ZH46_9EURO|nr:hypothetical protein BDV28DRAFT_125990 [Aspergillus coremiiformis]
MDDAIRPNRTAFDRVLCESFKLWASYLNASNTTPLLPFDCIDLKRLLRRTPSFLGCSLLSEDAHIPLKFVEKGSREGHYGLLSSCRSIWRTHCSKCPLEPITMPSHLILGVQSSLAVQISDSAPLAEWPGIQGISGHDEGNYLAVLFLAWAYILSARWAELLRSASSCKIKYATGNGPSFMVPSHQCAAEIDLGYHAEKDEAGWWAAILSSGGGRHITAEYNQRTYLSPWSVTTSDTSHIAVMGNPSVAGIELPSSSTALKYLARFSSHHRLYGQCSAALVAVLYVPFLSGRSVSLPMPKQVLRSQSPARFAQPDIDIVGEHGRLLPYYMTLSSNVWGMRSLLCSTFFNADIECNLVTAWLNPAFTILDPLLQANNMPMLAKVLASRQPKFGSLWLGAIIMGIAKSTLQDMRIGLTALDLNVAAWTGTDQSFITLKPGVSDGITIRREDECRLLFITGCDGFTKAPIYPWKPFGATLLCDTEPHVQQHACCGCHYLEYHSWNWSLENGEELEDLSVGLVPDDENDLNTHVREQYPIARHDIKLSSDSLSEAATRGIFSWLRSTGYPANEKPIYQHSWIDIESSDDEDVDDVESSTTEGTGSREFIDEWLSNVDQSLPILSGRSTP